MICVSIATESRRMAMADMLTAAHQADLLEVRLDRFDKAPDFAELLAARRKPVILSCRRARDGGEWRGTEDERLALLRQCVVHKADYVEIELDVADQIRPFPGARRVIAYTNLGETPDDIAEIYDLARSKHPDVIKITTLARTPEEAWPLLQILSRSSVPTVVVGLGKPGLMLTVLGKKIGAPWAYAALGRGLEAYPGQPTIADLEEVYHYRAIERTTRLIGVTGFEEPARATVAGLNAALAHLALPARCWPVSVGDPGLFKKIISAAKLASVVIADEHQHTAAELATDLDPAAQQARAADLLLHKNERWRGYQTQCGVVVTALEAALPAGAASRERSLPSPAPGPWPMPWPWPFKPGAPASSSPATITSAPSDWPRPSAAAPSAPRPSIARCTTFSWFAPRNPTRRAAKPSIPATFARAWLSSI